MIRDIAVLGMMLAMLEAVKRALEFLPNIELVTLLFILFTLFYGAKTLLAAFAFTGVECLVFGAGLWNFMYLYIWPLEVLLVLLMGGRVYCLLRFLRRLRTVLRAALLDCLHIYERAVRRARLVDFRYSV